MRWFLFRAAKEPSGSAGYWAIFIFFFELLENKSAAAAMRYDSVLLLLQRQLAEVSPVESPIEHSVPGEAAKEDSLRAIIPSGISGSVLVIKKRLSRMHIF